MLDFYKDKRPVIYNLLKNEILFDKVSHAYLFDMCNNDMAFSFIMAFIKDVIYNDYEKNSIKIDKDILFDRIDYGNYPEFRIIKPDGLYIKKQQIQDLQKEFSRNSIEGIRRVYIIYDCDKLRLEAANSLLKFLEEPENNVMAVLITNNFNNVLSTLVSRCQVINFGGDKVNDDLVYQENVINFVYDIETIGINTIINEKELLSSIDIKDRNNVIFFVDQMIDIYMDIFKYKNKMLVSDSFLYKEKFDDICSYNSFDRILKKINYLISVRDSIKYNVNINLLFDNIIINLGGDMDDSWY